jgi:glycosyltransferase involved in cell wall biosynthesis
MDMGKLEAKTMNDPLVSVILPVRDAQEFLNIAIDSLLRQSYPNFEVILVDYGSSDQTPSIIGGYADRRLKYCQTTDSDIGSALLHGVKQSRGEYLALMDQSGVSYLDRLRYQVDYLRSYEHIDIATSNYDLIDEDSRLIDSQRNDIDIGRYIRYALGSPFDYGSTMVRASAATKDTLSKLVDKWSGLKTDQVSLMPQKLSAKRLVEIPKKSLKELDVSQPWPAYEFWLRVATKGDGSLHRTKLGLDDLHGVWEIFKLGAIHRLLLESYLENLASKRFGTDDSPRPLVSVVMSVYNGGKFLKAAVQSILDQTFSDLEFVIIDDGSTDDSAKIINKASDPRIVLVRQTNHGLVYSLNKAVRLSEGEFIARMDADDISTTDRLEKQLSVLLGSPRVGVVGSFWQYIDETDKKSITMLMPPKNIDLKRALYIDNPFAHGSTMIRRSALKQAGGYRDDYGPTEDFDLWRRIADNWDFYEIPEVLYLYRITATGISQTSSETQANYARQIMHEQLHKPLYLKSYRSIINDAKYYKQLDSKFAPKIYRQYLDQQYLISRALLGTGAFKSGVLNSLALIRLQPSFTKSLLRPTIGGLLRRVGIQR